MTSGTVRIQIVVLLTSLGLHSIHIVNTRFLYNVPCVQNKNDATGFEKWIAIFANCRFYWPHILHEYVLRSTHLLKVNNDNMPYLVCWTCTSSGQRNTQLGHQLNHHHLQQHCVAMTRLLDREVSLQESCLHVGMQVRQSHNITEVNWYPSYIVEWS